MMDQYESHGNPARRIIGILTDFGPDNHYVAQMKGRMLATGSDLLPVDITHSIRPQNVLHGAYVLADTIEAFPSGTVFVVVVDPGVGTDRRILIVEANGQIFVLPDNGLISRVQRQFSIKHAISVDTGRFPASSTFHGRDIMAPLAALLANGESPAAWGQSLLAHELVQLEALVPAANIRPDGRHEIEGSVVYSDLFGNLISNIDETLLPSAKETCSVQFGGRRLSGIRRTFADVAPGEMLALIGSHRRLEVAVNQGHAEQLLLRESGQDPVGQVITVEW